MKNRVRDGYDCAFLGVACIMSYWIATWAFRGAMDRAALPLSGMWSVVATVFVFRDSELGVLKATGSRLIATCVSVALCLAYLVVFRASAVGLGVLIGLGAWVLIALDRREDVVTAGITTAVVMVVAVMTPRNAWLQPLLRSGDTLVGMAVGVAFKLASSKLYEEPPSGGGGAHGVRPQGGDRPRPYGLDAAPPSTGLPATGSRPRSPRERELE